jgi:hypothetical protein
MGLTPDGIESSDWDEVLGLTAMIVNLSVGGDEGGAADARLRLLRLLSELEEKYGPKPSLLATRADYVDSLDEKENWLQRAYTLAHQLGDVMNMVWVASSLASFYIEEAADTDKGAEWLSLTREHLAVAPDESEWDEVARLEALLLNA